MIKKFFIIFLAAVLVSFWIYFSFFFADTRNSLVKKPQATIRLVGREVGSTTLPAAADTNNFPREGAFINAPLLAERRELKILFFGDLMLDRHVKEKIDKHGLEYLFLKLDEDGLFNSLDLVSANLEGAVTDNGIHYPPANSYDFAFNPATVGGLKKYGFNFFNLANNHLADQGSRGIIETRKNLNQLDINYAGCNDGEVSECSFTQMEIGGWTVGMAGFSMVYKKFDISQAKDIISNLASSSDLVVVNMHWGSEYNIYFSQGQQTTAKALIEAGADLIIGHHPHVVQGMEIYRGRPIFYSLGNFIFDQYFSEETQTGLAINLIYQKGLMEIFLWPFKSFASQPKILTGKEREKFLQAFSQRSKLEEKSKEQVLTGRLQFLLPF